MEKTLNEIGQQNGVHPVVVGQWKKELIERAATWLEGTRGPKPAAHTDDDRLCGELKMALGWLNTKSGRERRGTKGRDRSRRGTGTVAELPLRLTKYVAFYNNERPHQSLGNRTPNAVYADSHGGGVRTPDQFGGVRGCSPRNHRVALFCHE